MSQKGPAGEHAIASSRQNQTTRRRDGRFLGIAALVIACCCASNTKADEFLSLPRTIFGDPGLVEMPSARMAPDGELSASVSISSNTKHYNLGFQVTPWLETSFRYSGLNNFDPRYSSYYDRSFAVKARLWNETAFFPALAVGLNDIIGTGIYSGEYIVVSKRVSDLDFSLGVGWGRLGSTALFQNPLVQISSSFASRSTATATGASNFGVFFHGPNASLFGGVSWATPIEGLSLIAEYSSDNYTEERSRGNFAPRNQLNLAATYQLSNTIQLGMQWRYGTAFGATISILLDPKKSPYPATIAPPQTPVVIRSEEQQQAALVGVLRRRNQAEAPSTKPSTVARSVHEEFSDALFRFNELADVEIRGSVLLLKSTQNRGDLLNQCSRYAGLAQTYESGFSAVVLTDQGSDKILARCSVSAFVPAKPDDAQWGATQVPVSATTISIAGGEGPARSAQVPAEQAIRSAAGQQRIQIVAIEFGPSDATVYYANKTYFSEAEAVERLSRILMANAPPNIEIFHLIALKNTVPQREFTIYRSSTERALSQAQTAKVITGASSEAAPMKNPVWDRSAQNYPAFSWNIYPNLRQALFDPINPFTVQFLVGLNGSVELFRGFTINAGLEASIYDNFNVARPSDSLLPHVRSDFQKYFSSGKNGINNLNLEYRFRLAPTVFAIAKAGYLESMFAGAGAEVLWRPEGQRWALGVDYYRVRQRGFSRLFSLQDYEANTGHVSLYYQSPWYDLNFVVRAGQYLAGDRGLTFEVTRRFSTGVEIGAFMTKTNVSQTQFGEGSFDKGIMIRIPLNWVTPIEIQSVLSMDLRPIQRDGGQRLNGDAVLFEETRRTSPGEMRLQSENQTSNNGGAQ